LAQGVGKGKGKEKDRPAPQAGPEEEVIDLMSEDDDDGGGVEIVETDVKPNGSKKVKKEEKNEIGTGKEELEEAMPQRLVSQGMASTSASKSSSTRPVVKSEPTAPLFSIFSKPSHPNPSPSKTSSSSNPLHKLSPTKHLPNSSSTSKTVPLAQPPKEYPNLDVDPLLFSPSSIDTSYWPLGRMPYAFLVEACFVRVGSTKKRLAIGRIITNLLRVVIYWDPASLCSAVYL
jgi:hypothetical protein